MKHTRQHAPLPHLYLQAYSFNAERFTPRRRPKSEHFIGTPARVRTLPAVWTRIAPRVWTPRDARALHRNA